MSSESRKRPGENGLAKILDWVRLVFGLGVLIILTNLTVSTA